MSRDPRWDLKKAWQMGRSLAKPMGLRLASLMGFRLATLTESNWAHQMVCRWVIHLDWRMVPTTAMH